MKIAFDIDDTLLVPSLVHHRLTGGKNDVPNYEVISILKWFQLQGNEIILWSAGGMDYARHWGEKFGLEPFEVREKKKSEDIDICFDDCDVDLAKVNVKVKRILNSVNRKVWNEHKGVKFPEGMEGAILK